MFDVLHAKPSPCKDCSDREIGCHGKCNIYKQWKIDLNKLRDNIYHEEYNAGKTCRYHPNYFRNLMSKKDRKRGRNGNEL